METFLGALFIAFMLGGIIILSTYVVLGIVLNKLNRRIYGYGTPMAWIPFLNFYLLGKLTINKYVGWGIIICLFLTGSYSTEVNGVTKKYAILPEGVREGVLFLTNVFIFVLFIYAIFKYYKLEKQAVINNQMTMNNQTPINNNQGIQNQVANQTTINNLTNQSSVNNQNNNNSNQ